MGKVILRTLTVLAWCWFLVCLALSLNAFGLSHPVAAIGFIMCGASALPPLWKWVRVTGGWQVQKRYRALLGGVALVAAASLDPLPVPEKPARGTQPTTLAATPMPAAGPAKVKVALEQNDAARSEMARKEEKLSSLLAGVKALSERDYEARLTFWTQIVALAPSNARYVREKRQIADKVASLDALRDHPEQGVVVERIRPRKEGFGNVLVIDITLRNDSLSNLKDFQVTCISSGRSGSSIGRNTRVLYDLLEARSTKTFRKLNMGFINGQTSSTRCIVDTSSVT